MKKWLLKWLLADIKIDRSVGQVHTGPFMIIKAPPNWRECAHDADRAFYCDGYIVFFYSPRSEELKA